MRAAPTCERVSESRYGHLVLHGVLAACFLLASVAVLWRASRRRHDRPLSETMARVAGATFLAMFGVGFAGWEAGMAALFFALIFGSGFVGMFIVWRRRRERRALMEVAIAAGVPPLEAHQRYRATPAGPVVVFLWWVFGMLAASFAIIGVFAALRLPASAVSSPSWRFPEAIGGMDAPWWEWGIAIAALGAVVHAVVNSLRA